MMGVGNIKNQIVFGIYTNFVIFVDQKKFKYFKQIKVSYQLRLS